MRIHGRIGDWPVELDVELSDNEYRLLAAALRGEAPTAAAAPESATSLAGLVAAPGSDERLWQLAQECLRRSSPLEGPALLADLAALAGSEPAGKRLLVRLRHHPQVVLETCGTTTRYGWVDQ